VPRTGLQAIAHMNSEKPFILRPAANTDFPAIRRLIHQVQINPTGLNWRRFLVAVDEQGQLVGCGQTKRHGDGSREMASIAVEPAWRGGGVARAIIERLLAENPIEVYLTCRAELGSFYERFGFCAIRVGEMPAYFRRLYRLVNAVHTLRLLPGEMLVMRRSEPPDPQPQPATLKG
jgi:amino-acid N-acetyltransferase